MLLRETLLRSSPGGVHRPWYRVRRQACAIGERAFRAPLVRAGLGPNMQDCPKPAAPYTAVHMAEYGVSVDEIGQILGHTNSKIAYRVYALFSPSYLKRLRVRWNDSRV
jgi:hypothetical protein